jgi:hypothetical protein
MAGRWKVGFTPKTPIAISCQPLAGYRLYRPPAEQTHDDGTITRNDTGVGEGDVISQSIMTR